MIFYPVPCQNTPLQGMGFVVLAIIFQIFTYISTALFFNYFLAIWHNQVLFSKLFRYVITLTFLNYVFPSANLSGMSFLLFLKKDQVPQGKATVLSALYYILLNVTFYFFTFYFNVISFILRKTVVADCNSLRNRIFYIYHFVSDFVFIYSKKLFL